MSARLLARALGDPAAARRWTRPAGPRCWRWRARNSCSARSPHGSTGWRAGGGRGDPRRCARARAEQGRRRRCGRRRWRGARWRRSDCRSILLKGTAYAAAGLAAGQGRSIGDLDMLVPRDGLDAVEAALLAAGWEWVKPDAYDDAYYRRWMHELPPLVHPTRDRMIDVHHTILPPTARPTPDAAALIADSVALANGLRVLSPDDMIIHAAAHLFADGDLAGGLRNLWDIDRLCREFGERRCLLAGAGRRAARHELARAVARALRLAHALYGTPVARRSPAVAPADRLFRRRLLARDGWGARRGRRRGSASTSARTCCACRRRCWRGICGPSGAETPLSSARIKREPRRSSDRDQLVEMVDQRVGTELVRRPVREAEASPRRRNARCPRGSYRDRIADKRRRPPPARAMPPTAAQDRACAQSACRRRPARRSGRASRARRSASGEPLELVGADRELERLPLQLVQRLIQPV